MKHFWKIWGRTALGLVLGGLLVFGLTRSAWAADFRGGDNVIISADEVIDDDLFVSGNRVEVDGTVKGDLFASAQEVIVNGEVEGSLFITGQTLKVNGQVGGSVYGGGYALTIGREVKIGRNLYFGGFSLTTEKSSTIGRSLYAGDYQTILDGEVANDVQVGGGALELNGIVGGDVKGEVGGPDQPSPPPFMPNFPGSVPMVATGLRVGENAEIGGDLDVQVAQAVEVDVGSSISRFFQSVLRQRLGEFIALLLVGGLLLYFWPNIVQRASVEAQERPLPSAGWGCLVTLLFPIGVIIVGAIVVILAILGGLITFGQLFGDILGLGGTTLGLVVAVFSLVVSIVTKAIVAFLGGRLILTRLASQMKPGWWLNFASLALGAIIYEILRVIPFLGWIVSIIVVLVGLGAIYVVLRQMMRPPPPPPEVAPVPEAAAV